MGHAAAELSDVREPVENDDLVTFTATFASGATGTLSASRVAFGLANSLGFELFTTAGAATFDLGRASEFGFADRSADPATSGMRQVPIGPAHPYITAGLAMDFPGVGYGQNDLFVWQARAFLDQVAGVGRPGSPATVARRGRSARRATAAGRRRVRESAAPSRRRDLALHPPPDPARPREEPS